MAEVTAAAAKRPHSPNEGESSHEPTAKKSRTDEGADDAGPATSSNSHHKEKAGAPFQSFSFPVFTQEFLSYNRYVFLEG